MPPLLDSSSPKETTMMNDIYHLIIALTLYMLAISFCLARVLRSVADFIKVILDYMLMSLWTARRYPTPGDTVNEAAKENCECAFQKSFEKEFEMGGPFQPSGPPLSDTPSATSSLPYSRARRYHR